MSAATIDRDMSLKAAEEAVELMRAHGSSGDPRAYHIFYTHALGQHPALSLALGEALASTNILSEATTESLYDRFLSPTRFMAQAEKTGFVVLNEIDTVMDLIELAMGSTDEYNKSLVAISTDLEGPTDKQRLKEMVLRMAQATNETIATNRTLEARLRETRGEIQDLRETLESIRTESLTDPLTTLANRKHLDGMLLRCVDHAALSGEPLSVLMMDVDHFKHFNDTWGHLTGDQVLRLVAMSIKGEVRPTDTAARFGGEEFAILLPQSSLKTAFLIAERIRQTVMSRELVKRSTGEALGRLTISVGAASFMKGDTAALLLERADRCLLEAKRTGRNKTVSEADMADPKSDPEPALSDVA